MAGPGLRCADDLSNIRADRSGASASSKNDPTANTMDMPEYMKFLQAAELLDQSLTVREARAIFVQVNLVK